MRNHFLILVSAFSLLACRQERHSNIPNAGPAVSRFEISCHSQVDRLDLRVDSNGIFLAAGRYDTILYGKLPDDLRAGIDTMIGIIKTGRLQNTPPTHHSNLSIVAITGSDTIRVQQGTDVDKDLNRLTQRLMDFVRGQRHTYFTLTNVFLPTLDDYYLPPPIKR